MGSTPGEAPRPLTVLFCLSLVWVTAPIMSGGVASANAQPADESPIEALRRQSEAVLAASTLDEAIDLLPAEQVAYVRQMSPEEQAAGLAEWKRDVSGLRPFMERVFGERAVVALDDPSAGATTGMRVLTMSLGEGGWRVTGEETLLQAVPAASGTLEVAGDRTASVETGFVSLIGVNGAFLLEVADLAAALDESENDGTMARLQIPLAEEFRHRCFDPGPIRIATVTTEGEYGVTLRGGLRLGAGESEELFDRDLEGTLEVITFEGKRFSGRFAVRMASADGSRVEVVGTVGRALMPCAL